MSFEAVGWALEQPVGGAKKIILIGIASHADRHGRNAWPSIETLATYAHVDPRSVRRALAELEADGYLSRVVGGGGTRATVDHKRPNLYHVNMQREAGTPADEAPAESLSTGRTPASPPDARVLPTPDADVPPTPDASVRYPLTPTSSEPSIEPPLRNTPQPPTGGADGFAKFFEAYPRQMARDRAQREWDRLAPDAALQRVILASVAAQRKSPDWLRDGGRYVPLPSKWLKGRRWTDAAGSAEPVRAVGPDPALAKIERDRKLAAPPPPAVKQKIAELLGPRRKAA